MNSKIVYRFGNLHDNIGASSDILQFWDSSCRSDENSRGVPEQAQGCHQQKYILEPWQVEFFVT